MPPLPPLPLLLLLTLLIWRHACPLRRAPEPENGACVAATILAREGLRAVAERPRQQARKRTLAVQQCVGDGLVLVVALVARNTRARAACEGQEHKRQSLRSSHRTKRRQGEGEDEASWFWNGWPLQEGPV